MCAKKLRLKMRMEELGNKKGMKWKKVVPNVKAKKEKNELKRVKAEQQIEEKNQRALELNVEDDKNVLKLAA